MSECTSGREIADDRFVGQTFTSLKKDSTVLNRVTFFFFPRHVGEYLWHFWSPTDIFSRLGRVGDHDWPGLGIAGRRHNGYLPPTLGSENVCVCFICIVQRS